MNKNYNKMHNGKKFYKNNEEDKVDEVNEIVEEVLEKPKQIVLVTGKVINCHNVNFREEPSLESNVLKIIAAGSEVKIKNIKNGWAAVNFDGMSGFIKEEYISK